MMCPKCHLEVASQDPERVQIELDVYHGPCLKQLRNELELDMAKNRVPSHPLRNWPSRAHDAGAF